MTQSNSLGTNRGYTKVHCQNLSFIVDLAHYYCYYYYCVFLSLLHHLKFAFLPTVLVKSQFFAVYLNSPQSLQTPFRTSKLSTPQTSNPAIGPLSCFSPYIYNTYQEVLRSSRCITSSPRTFSSARQCKFFRTEWWALGNLGVLREAAQANSASELAHQAKYILCLF